MAIFCFTFSLFTANALFFQLIRRSIRMHIPILTGVQNKQISKTAKITHVLKTISSLQQFKTPFNASCSLVQVCKDIILKYGRTRSKRFFSAVGTFYLTGWTLFKNFLKHLSMKLLE